MKNIHLKHFPAFSSKYVGTPYHRMDCWNIVKAFYEEVMDCPLTIVGPDRPLGPDDTEPLIRSLKGRFTEVEEGSYQFGDILVLRLYGRPVHLGIYLNDTHVLHTQMKVGCIIDRLSRWENMIEGCYRHGS